MKVDFFWLVLTAMALIAAHAMYTNLRLSFETGEEELRSLLNTGLMIAVMIAVGVCTGYAFNIKFDLRFLPSLVLLLPVILAANMLAYAKKEQGHGRCAVGGFFILFLVGVTTLSV